MRYRSEKSLKDMFNKNQDLVDHILNGAMALKTQMLKFLKSCCVALRLKCRETHYTYALVDFVNRMYAKCPAFADETLAQRAHGGREKRCFL